MSEDCFKFTINLGVDDFKQNGMLACALESNSPIAGFADQRGVDELHFEEPCFFSSTVLNDIINKYFCIADATHIP